MQVGHQVRHEQDPFAVTFRGDRCGLQAGKIVSCHVNVRRVFQQDPVGDVLFDLSPGLLFPTDVAVGEVIPSHSDATAFGADAKGKILDEDEGVRGDRTSPGMLEIDTATEFMCNNVGTDGNAIAIAVEDDSGAVALLDHVAGHDRTISIFDDDAVPEMVVDVVSGHAQIKAIDADQCVLVLFKMIA